MNIRPRTCTVKLFGASTLRVTPTYQIGGLNLEGPRRVPILIEYNSRTGEYSRIYTHSYSPNILIKYKLSRSQYKRTEIYDFYTAKVPCGRPSHFTI